MNILAIEFYDLFVSLRSSTTRYNKVFKDKSVISSIPTYFEIKESTIICYKYNKTIRSTVLNYNKLVMILILKLLFLILENVRNLNIAINLLVI